MKSCFGLSKSVSIKNIITTRAYCSSIAIAMGDEIIIDCPYQIITAINENTATLIGIHHNTILNVAGIQIVLLGMILLFSYQYKNSVTSRLNEFIDYDNIKMQTRYLIVIISVVLFRNVNNAI